MEAIGSGFDGSPLSPYSDRKGESFKTLSQQAVFKLSVSRSRLRDDVPSDTDNDDDMNPRRKRRELRATCETDVVQSPFAQEHEQCRGDRLVMEQEGPMSYAATDGNKITGPPPSTYERRLSIEDDEESNRRHRTAGNASESAQITYNLIHHPSTTSPSTHEETPTQLSPAPTESDDCLIEREWLRCRRSLKTVVTAYYGLKCPICRIDCDVDLAKRRFKPRQDIKMVQEPPHTSLDETYAQFEEKQLQKRESEDTITDIHTPHGTLRGEQYLPRKVCMKTTTAGAVSAEEEEVADTATSLVLRDPTKATLYDPVKARFDPIERATCAISTSITGEKSKLWDSPALPVFHEPTRDPLHESVNDSVLEVSFSISSCGLALQEAPGKRYNTAADRLDRNHQPRSDSKHRCGICHSSFKRDGDLRRHLNSSHLKSGHKCDYPKCPRHTKTFGRKDRYREHLRDYHQEDLIPSGQNVTIKWVDTRRVDPKWWRCSKCLSRTAIKHGWGCSTCSKSCEADRIKWREQAGEPHKSPLELIDTGQIDVGLGARKRELFKGDMRMVS